MTLAMKKAYLQSWLDYQIETWKRTNKHEHCIDGIRLVSMYNRAEGQEIFTNAIFVTDVPKIADILGLPMKRFAFSEEYDEYQIEYKGVIFYSLEDKTDGK